MPEHANLSAASELHLPGVVSTTDPGAIGANKLWIDTGVSGTTTNPVWRQRNATDTGWLTITAAGGYYTIPFLIGDGVNAITTGLKGGLMTDVAGTIVKATLLALDGNTGSIVIDIWKDVYANHPPTVADTITASAKPTISSATKSQDSTLTGWTASLAAGDILFFNVDSVSTFTLIGLYLTVKKG